MKIIFTLITDNLIEQLCIIINSNQEYNLMENGRAIRTKEETVMEFMNPDTDSYLITVENEHVGIIDFLPNNPKDNSPWIGLLMIHKDYQGKGYGKLIYTEFEKTIRKDNYSKIRIGVLKDNSSAKKFWISMGFKFFKESHWQDKAVDCFEKIL